MLQALSCTESFDHPIAKKVVASLKAYGELFVNNELPAWYNWVATAVREVGLNKPGLNAGVRPVGIGCMLRTAITRCVFDADVRAAFVQKCKAAGRAITRRCRPSLRSNRSRWWTPKCSRGWHRTWWGQ